MNYHMYLYHYVKNIIWNSIMELNNMKREIKKETKVSELGLATESLSSVKVYKAAGNEIRYEIKVYDIDPDKALDKAIELMDKANKKYEVKE